MVLIQKEENVIVDNMINSFISMGGNYSPKMHSIYKHLPELLENQCSVSDEHEERVHQTMKLIEERFLGKTLYQCLVSILGKNVLDLNVFIKYIFRLSYVFLFGSFDKNMKID